MPGQRKVHADHSFPVTQKEKIGVIIKALKGFEMGDVYVIPVIRELLDKSVSGIEGENT